MTIDTKRLETDAAYWDECGAPEDASHWCTMHKKWIYNPEWYDDCCIPRPTKPAAPEWDGDGLPPVGCECEYRPDPETRPDWWEKCRYLAHCNEEYFVLMNHNIGVDRVNDSVPAEIRFRPLRTKEQRQREELVSIVNASISIKSSGPLSLDVDVGPVADAILSRYKLEPKK